MKQQEKDYDVILLGSGLGGLIAGAWLAKKGRSVLLLREKGYLSSYRRDGYRFTPLSNFSERRLRPSLVQVVAQELDLSFAEADAGKDLYVEKELGPLRRKAPFQVILPEARIDLLGSPSLFQMEWKREFPNELAQIEKFYEELGSLQDILRAQRKKEGSSFFPVDSRSIVRKGFPFLSFPEAGTDQRLSSFSKEFKAFLQLQWIAWGNLFGGAYPVSLAAYLLLHEERGEWAGDLDLEHLEGRILDSFLQSGGETEEIEKAKRVEQRWRKGFTLTLEGDRRLFRSQFLILNSPLHAFWTLLGEGGKIVSKWLEKIQPRYILFPCFLGIREKVVPVGMKDLLISILDLDKPCAGGNLLSLSLSPEGDVVAAPDGCRALTVQCLIPFRDWAQVSFDHRETIMKHLNHLIPFLDSYLDFNDFDWASEQTGRWSFPHILYSVPGGFNWREGIIPCRLAKNLYFTGKENFPYLGLEGEVWSGLRAARQILQKYS
jgi:phytoene dehydrogenase-like protein